MPTAARDPSTVATTLLVMAMMKLLANARHSSFDSNRSFAYQVREKPVHRMPRVALNE
jgi:hypothetical protein